MSTAPEPAATFAPAPAERRGIARDAVRLLVADEVQGITHARFHDLAEHLRPGDVVVVNDSATVLGQLDAHGAEHGRVVLHVGARLPTVPHPGLGADADCVHHVVEVRRAPDADRAVLDARAGEELTVAHEGVRVRLLAPYPRAGSSPTGRGDRLWRAAVSGDLATALQRAGRPISYGYLERTFPLADYQTVFARVPGSAEMPSAARPFTPGVVADLVARGVVLTTITLHTGFSSQEAGEGPQPEWFEVPAHTAVVVNAARRAGGRVVAVGTTVTRALESAVGATGEEPGGAVLRARSGWTTRVVTPDDPPRLVDGLISGWHDAEASHLLLVRAVAGDALTERAYTAARASGYLWHEFGDSSLFLPRRRSLAEPVRLRNHPGTPPSGPRGKS